MTITTAPIKSRWHIGRPRISVRTLIVLVLVVGGGLGWFAHRVRVQRRAVAAIKAVGGSVVYDWAIFGGNLNETTDRSARWKRLVDAIGVDYLGTVTRVFFGDDSENSGLTDHVLAEIGQLSYLEDLSLKDWKRVATDAGLAHIQKLSRLKGLDIIFSDGRRVDLSIVENLTELERLELRFLSISDADLSHLSKLVRLKDLSICVSPRPAGSAPLIGNAGLAYLEPLRGLESLVLDGTHVSTEGLAHLRGMGRLRSLMLGGTRVTSLEPLKDLVGLEFLGLHQTPMTDSGLAPVARFSRLKHLGLGATPIGDAGLVHIGRSASLEYLDLGRTKVTDAGMAHLADLPALQTLDLWRTDVGDAGVIRLPAFPRLKRLNLRVTKITDAGLMQLAAKLTAARPTAARPSYVIVDVFRTPVTPAGVTQAARPGLAISR